MFLPKLNNTGVLVVADDHIFVDITARDAYFVTNPSELVDNLPVYITGTETLQQYKLATTSWLDISPTIKGESGNDGTSINVTIAEEPPASPNNGDIWIDTNAADLVEPYNPSIRSHIADVTTNPHNVTATQVMAMPSSYLDTDETFAANSDTKVPSQKAVRTYIERALMPDCIGVEWDTSNSSPTLFWIDENANHIIGLSGAAFDTHPIFGNMMRCSLTSLGVPTFGTDAKGTGLTLTDDYIMVRIPKVYVKCEILGTFVRWWISSVPKTGFTLHPAFYQRGHSVSQPNQLYVGAYTAGANGGTTTANGVTNTIMATDLTGLKLTSKAGVKNLTNNTVTQFEAAANLIGTGWGLMNFWTHSLLELLFFVEYGSFNSQLKLGQGRTSGSNTSAALTGTNLAQADEGAGVDIQSLLAANGTYGVQTLYESVVWRGIENLWGNIYQFVPGYNPTDTEHHVLNRDGTGTISGDLAVGSYDTVTSPAPLNGTTNISGTDNGAYCSGYVSSLAFDSSRILNLAFIPNTLTGSSSQYLPDSYYSHQSGLGRNGILLVGGGWNSGGTAGVGYRNAVNGLTGAGFTTGVRAEFIG